MLLTLLPVEYSLQASAEYCFTCYYWLANLDTAANTADGQRIGYGITASGTSFLVTANARGADCYRIGPVS